MQIQMFITINARGYRWLVRSAEYSVLSVMVMMMHSFTYTGDLSLRTTVGMSPMDSSRILKVLDAM
jgi:hypothetical protein